jgi:hypothetical protein
MNRQDLTLAWRDFWFRPTPTSTLAVFRAAYGFVVFAWTVSVIPDAFAFFSPSGVFSRQYRGWGVLETFNSKPAVVAAVLALGLSALALVVGYRTRLASVVSFIALSSLIHRNPYLKSGGDSLLLTMGFFLMFAPAGASLSIDRLRRSRERFWEFPRRAQWALRFVQIQVSLMYLFTVFAKVQGETWPDGTAVGYAWQVAHYVRLPIPQAVIDSVVLINLMTWGTLVIELSLAILVWNRRLRPWVLAAGIALHLSIELTLRVGFFSWAVLVMYIAFVPPETMSRWLLKRRDEISAWRFRRQETAIAEEAGTFAGTERSR